MKQQTAHRIELSHWASGLNTIAGIYLAISPWFYDLSRTTAGAINSLVFGILIAAVAVQRYDEVNEAWISWINGIAALWLIVSPWVIGYAAETGLVINTLIASIIVLILAVWNAQLGVQAPGKTGSKTI